MWQRFSERARKVVFYAQEEAQRFGEGYVSTEHLLLGLLCEPESTACRVLVQFGISLDRIRQEIEKQLPRGEHRPSQDMTLTPRAKRVIDLSYEEARNLNHNYIGTEHILLGLVREGDGLAGRVLAKLGVELEAIRALIVATLGIGTEPDAPPSTSDTRSPQSSPYSWLLLSLRRSRMIADLMCLIFLSEYGENARNAVLTCGVNPISIETVIEEAILATKTPEELVEGTLSGSELLVRANIEAKNLEQELNGAHFLLAALAEGTTATAKTLLNSGVSYDAMKAAIVSISA